jgi:2-polyprenyl-3-methyl-5-hydroxy-6-metoxy-1,4-benzoquinol methylase
MALRALVDRLPPALREPLRALYRRIRPADAEPMMYRVHLFEELLALSGRTRFAGTRILEIGPRDGLDSKRLAALSPAELVMVELPEKHGVTAPWVDTIPGPKRYIEANLMYMARAELDALGRFDLVWCTGVLYHNAEQLRMLRRLFTLLRPGGFLVLESATFRGPRALRDQALVQVYFPDTYRNTGTITHLPTPAAINAWLGMAGFEKVHASRCFDKSNRDVAASRMACIAQKGGDDDGAVYYGKSGLNPDYRLGDST